METKAPSQRRYPPDMKERAVKLVQDTIEREGESFGVIGRIARQLDVGTESLRYWVRRAEVERGERAGTSASDQQRLKDQERELRELRRANEILKAAASFFARELDPRPPR
jgi:transposase